MPSFRNACGPTQDGLILVRSPMRPSSSASSGRKYHEHTLEEQYVFPEVRKSGGPNEKLVEVLLVQHQCRREITDYLYRIGSRGQIGGDAEPLARALASTTACTRPTRPSRTRSFSRPGRKLNRSNVSR